MAEFRELERQSVQTVSASLGDDSLRAGIVAGRVWNADGEPVLLCLGDHLFRGRGTSCHRRLMQAYDRCGGRSVSATASSGQMGLRR